MILEEKCPHWMPPCNFCKIVDTCSSYKIRQNLLSCPKLYSISFWSINGLVLWAKYCLWDVVNLSSITPSNKDSYTLYNHSGCRVNNVENNRIRGEIAHSNHTSMWTMLGVRVPTLLQPCSLFPSMYHHIDKPYGITISLPPYSNILVVLTYLQSTYVFDYLQHLSTT
jgi:hypothetical protein